MSVTLHDFIAQLISAPCRGASVILQNAHGSTELLGDDLYVSATDEWMTLYHRETAQPEDRSHLHLRRGSFAYARVVEREGQTARVVFSTTRETFPGDDEDAPLSIYFRSFYEYSDGGKRLLPDRRAAFEAWVGQHGREFVLSR